MTDTTIGFNLTQFSGVFLFIVWSWLLMMGYGLKGEQGGWFIIFGSMFGFALMAACIAIFGGLWWLASPTVFGILSIITFRDGILKAFMGQDTDNRKER
jgi:hypothetical protein